MGFFSWLTADTHESIASSYSSMPVKPVYLLQPGGAAPIREDAYEGYGCFGGTNAYEWLARANMHLVRQTPEWIARFTEDELHSIGVTFGVGSYYVDQTDGSMHTIFHEGPSLIDPAIRLHRGTYDAPIAHFGGRTGNQLIAEGRLVETSFVCDNPLKFSHDPRAIYQDLAKSEDCPYQGFFYEAAEEGELVH